MVHDNKFSRLFQRQHLLSMHLFFNTCCQYASMLYCNTCCTYSSWQLIPANISRIFFQMQMLVFSIRLFHSDLYFTGHTGYIRQQVKPKSAEACTYWCSIWKLRWPVNQSLNGEESTLQVVASWRENQSSSFSFSTLIGKWLI